MIYLSTNFWSLLNPNLLFMIDLTINYFRILIISEILLTT